MRNYRQIVALTSGTVIVAIMTMNAGAQRSERRKNLPIPSLIGVITLKTDPAQVYLASRHVIKTLDDVSPLQWSYGPKLRQLASSLDTLTLGPLEYHVKFEDGHCAKADEARYFARELDIVIPLESQSQVPDRSQLISSPAFRCLSIIYQGSPWDAAVYWDHLYAEAKRRGFHPSCENRELVVDHTGFDKTKYVDELQLGVQ